MNRRGVKPESLKGEQDVVVREFVDAVGDDSISRFDTPKRRGRGSRRKSKKTKR